MINGIFDSIFRYLTEKTYFYPTRSKGKGRNKSRPFDRLEFYFCKKFYQSLVIPLMISKKVLFLASCIAIRSAVYSRPSI